MASYIGGYFLISLTNPVVETDMWQNLLNCIGGTRNQTHTKKRITKYVKYTYKNKATAECTTLCLSQEGYCMAD